MASPPMQSSDISILTPDYMALLQGLCVNTEPSLNDVTTIFKEFSRSLDARKPKLSPKPSTSSSTSSGASKKRGGKSAARASAASDDADEDGSGILHSDVGFERSCTWEPDEKPCWLMSDVELWNRILTKNCIELREYMWGELVLQGYEWPEQKPGQQDMLRASLLMHVLLRQHRCVTYICFDMAETVIERYVMWHAVKIGAGGVKRLEYKPNAIDVVCLIPLTESTICCEAIASMTNMTLLSISSMYFSNIVVSVIGGYVEKATSLTELELLDIEADDTNAGLFLDHLARNRSVKSLIVHELFLLAREGRALADVVLNHVTLEQLNVMGSLHHSPSALLAAAAHSQSLRSLTVEESFIDAADIETLASALAIPSQPPDCDEEEMRPPPTSRLRKLSFRTCGPFDSELEAAYAKLIGGVLVELTLAECGLGGTFALRATRRLLHYSQLRELNVEKNTFTIYSLRNFVEVLQVNKTLKGLVVNMTAEHSEEDVSSLFEMIRQINAFPRLWFQWVYPRASDFPKSTLTGRTPSVCINLDGYGEEEAAGALRAIASNRNLDVASIECCTKAEPAVLQRLADSLASTKSLKHLNVSLVNLADVHVVNLFRALESNRTIFMMVFNAITFGKKNAKALGRLVERNRSFIFLTVNLQHSDSGVDRMVQVRNICRELKEALRRNRFILNVNVSTERSIPSNDPAIRETLRQNSMLVNQAIRFVNGSMDKTDALAFEALQHCESVPIRMYSYSNISYESAVEKVAEARERLALNYFVLAGIVKAEIACQRNRKAKKKRTLLDNISRVMQARICSYLSLTDVVDI